MRVLLTDLVEMLADLGVETNAQVVVDCELTVRFSHYCHLPTV